MKQVTILLLLLVPLVSIGQRVKIIIHISYDTCRYLVPDTNAEWKVWHNAKDTIYEIREGRFIFNTDSALGIIRGKDVKSLKWIRTGKN